MTKLRSSACGFVFLFSCFFPPSLYADYIISSGEIVDYDHPLSDFINDVELRLSASFTTGITIRTEDPERLLLIESNGGYADQRDINIVFERGNAVSCPSGSRALPGDLCVLEAPVASLSTQGSYGTYASSPRAVSFITRGQEPLTYGLPDTDDGRLNFVAGDIVHIPFKIFLEAEIFSTYVSFFSRLIVNFDPILYSSRTYRRSIPRGVGLSEPSFLAYKTVGFGLEFLDLYAILDIPFPETWDSSLSIRLGRFGISWGTSLFLPFNLNVISPIDVSSALQPGRDLRELRKPVEAVQLQGSLPFGFSFDLFYQLRFRQLEFPPTGTPVSTSDLFYGGSNSDGNLKGQSYDDLSGERVGDPYGGGLYRRNCSNNQQHPLSYRNAQGVSLLSVIRDNIFSSPCSVNYTDLQNPTENYHPSLSLTVDNNYLDYRSRIRTGYLEKTRNEAFDPSIIGKMPDALPTQMTQGGLALHFSGGSSPLYALPFLGTLDVSLYFANYHSREPFPSSYFDRFNSRALELSFGTVTGLTTTLKDRLIPSTLGACSVVNIYFPRVVVAQSHQASENFGCSGLGNLNIFVPDFTVPDLVEIFSFLRDNEFSITQSISADLDPARLALARLNQDEEVGILIVNHQQLNVLPKEISSKYLAVFPRLFDLTRETVLSLAQKFANVDVLSILTRRTINYINKLTSEEITDLIDFIPQNSVLTAIQLTASPEQAEEFLIPYLLEKYPDISSREDYILPGQTITGKIFSDLALVLAALQTQCLPYDEEGDPLSSGCQHYLANGAEVFRVIPKTSVFFEYPQDIQMIGASFSTVVGAFDIFGEFIWRRNQPFLLELEDLLVSLTENISPLYGRTDMLSFSTGVIALAGPSDVIINFLGATQGILILEVGTLLFPRLLTSGTQLQKEKAFSMRYAMRLSLDYPAVFGTSVVVSPNVIWMHDPYGTAPIPELYQEGNYSIAATVDFSWPSSLKITISYTHYGYYGDNSPSPISDRDSFSFGLSYAF